jgi:alkanesulfonate monooxygenase SsuD/methylene tetrahydromethanopterin reductase-like flavin-dependent oxidoreductase (luciferase family)
MNKLSFYYMHQMPWPYLPDGFDETYDSAWITLPNAIYDPLKGRDLYTSYFDELERADQLGWDGVIIPEHHQNVSVTIPSPNLIGAALTQRIKRAKIGIVGNTLPLHSDPLRVAEEIAMLDVMSGGRIISGFVRGIGMEYFNYGVNPTTSRERMNEAHDLIVQAWTKPGPFAFEGDYYNYRYVNIWPRPIQQPHPPIWLPGSLSQETIDMAARHKYPYMTVFMTTEQRKMAYGFYRRLAEERYGYEASPEQLAFCTLLFIAETDEQAMKEAEQYILWVFEKGFFKVRPQYVSPPGYNSEQSTLNMLKSGIAEQMLRRRSFKELVDTGVVIVGSVDTVIEKLAYHTEELRAGMIVHISRIGPMPDELVLKQQELMAKYVMPHFRAESMKLESQPIEVASLQ